MRLIILAAGYGGRLSPATESTPKSLLDLGQNQTILDLQLNAAIAAGIESLWVVVGYEAEQIEAKLRERSNLPIQIKTLYNPFYRNTSNLVSLWRAREAMDEDFILLNGDTLFASGVMERCVSAPDGFSAVIARKSQYDADDNRVTIEGDKVTWIGRDIPDEETNGDWAGMCAVVGSARKRFVEKLDAIVRQPDKLLDYGYMLLFRDLLESDYKMSFIEIQPEEWAEVDFQMDLEFVRDHLGRYIVGDGIGTE
jgi:L-glutamine-phosphate cytidylyltransferase